MARSGSWIDDLPDSRRQAGHRLSLSLSIYIARHILIGIGIAIFALGLLAFLIDAVELLRRASEKEKATFNVALFMAVLHLPFLLQKLMPFAVLFGAMYSFQRLTRSHELVAARSVGVSVWQFMLPAVAVAAGVGIFIVVAFNPLASAMVAKFEQLEKSYLSSRSSLVSVSAGGLWLRQTGEEGEILVHARQMQRTPPILEQVVVLFYDAEGRFTARADAPTAVLEERRWRLGDALISRPDGQREVIADYVVPTDLTPGRIRESFAPPETMSFWDLPAFIDSLEAVGFSAREHLLYWHGLLALPLLLSAMLMIGTTCSLQLVRLGGAGALVILGLVAGFLFYIVSDIVFALGLSGRLPVALAAWTPAGIAILLGLTTLFYLEDG